MSLHLYISNKPEKLADHFIADVYSRRTLKDLFIQEIVVVQTQGMGAWLQQKMAEQTAIAANLYTPFLNSFIDQILLKSGILTSDSLLLTQDTMFWKIFHILMNSLERYPELERYVSGEHRAMKAVQMAEKTAALFDQYQIYHGEMLKEWRLNPSASGDLWQANLYREIAQNAAGRDQLLDAFLTQDLPAPSFTGLPQRVSIFGLSTLAPVYFHFFEKLSTVTDVHFFYLNPSSEYWSENTTRQEWIHGMQQEEETENILTGNPLLTSLGRQGRDFFRFLMGEQGTCEWEEHPLFEPFAELPAQDPEFHYQYRNADILHTIQQDILLNIRRVPEKRKQESDPFTGTPIQAVTLADNSLRIHSCYSKIREVEALHDQLLRLMEQDSVQPYDILVMAPDISEYEPYVQAVFSAGPLKDHFSFSDRSIRSVNHCADILLRLLQMMNGRFCVNEVMDLLNDPDLAMRWNLTSANQITVRNWLAKLQVRWGIDEANHEQFCGVPFPEYSWKQACDRLLSGYAVAENGFEQADEPIIPFDSAEGTETVVLGNFLAFLKQLFDLRKRVSGEHSLEEWCKEFISMPDYFFCVNDNNCHELSAIREGIHELRDLGQSLACDTIRFPLDVMTYLLENQLTRISRTDPFFRGKITFCSLVPMRSIPMNTIAVLGLEENAFPRRDFELGFNPVPLKQQRQALVRSRCLEDRELFLELLLAARKHLLLFYQGMDNKSNKPLPPAVPLAELKDTVYSTFPSLQGLVTTHRLQAFDPDYFTQKTGLYSYSESNYRASRAFIQFQQNGSKTEAAEGKYPRVELSVPDPAPEYFSQASPQELENFFLNPSKSFLKLCMESGSLYDDYVELEDQEDFSMDPLQAYTLRQQVGDFLIAGQDPQRILKLYRKTNRLPIGGLGISAFEDRLKEVYTLPESWHAALRTLTPKPVDITLADGFRIAGEIEVRSSDRNPYLYHWSNKLNSSLIRLRIRHLILTAAGETPSSHLWNYAEQKEMVMPPLPFDKAVAELTEWVRLYRTGHRHPLPFFPKASRCYAKGNPWDKVLVSFNPDSHAHDGDLDDSSICRLFRRTDFDDSDFTKEFMDAAEVIYGFEARGELIDG